MTAFFELVPLGTEGRESEPARPRPRRLGERAAGSFDELDENPWVLQLYAQDEPSFDQ